MHAWGVVGPKAKIGWFWRVHQLDPFCPPYFLLNPNCFCLSQQKIKALIYNALFNIYVHKVFLFNLKSIITLNSKLNYTNHTHKQIVDSLLDGVATCSSTHLSFSLSRQTTYPLHIQLHAFVPSQRSNTLIIIHK